MKVSDKNLPVRGELTDEIEPSSTLIPVCQDAATACPAPRPLARPVSLKGRVGPDGYEPENAEWWEVLTTPAPSGEQRRYGCDPMSIPPEVLAAAGHPVRRTRAILSALGDEPVDPDIRSYKDLRRHCLKCAESPSEVRRCTVIDCPLWPYRTQHNPHNPRRGRNPFNQDR
jgi:hypothetical protein